MTVLHILSSLEQGGVARSVLRIARQMVRRDIDVEILVLNHHRDFEPDFPVTIRSLELPENSLLAPGAAPATRAYRGLFGTVACYLHQEKDFQRRWEENINAHAYDAVIVHCLQTKLLSRHCDAGRSFYYIRNQKSQHLKGHQPLATILNRLTFRRTIADKRLIAVSEGVKQDLVNRFRIPPPSVRVCPNPYDLESIRERARDSVKTRDIPERFLLAVGRMSRQKRFDRLLKAYKRSGVSLPLVIVGEGPERPRLESLSRRLKIDDRTVFPGFLSDPFPLMRKASVFILSSDYEGLPNVAIEALGCGTPVVSTDCCGIREILTGELAAGIVPIRDTDTLARRIRQYVENPPPVPADALAPFREDRVIERLLTILRDE